MLRIASLVTVLSVAAMSCSPQDNTTGTGSENKKAVTAAEKKSSALESNNPAGGNTRVLQENEAGNEPKNLQFDRRRNKLHIRKLLNQVDEMHRSTDRYFFDTDADDPRGKTNRQGKAEPGEQEQGTTPEEKDK